MNIDKKLEYADVNTESIKTLFKIRTPSLIIGLMMGIGISLITSRFEEVLSQNIQIAFFLPFIIYSADAIGTQTEAIYSRDVKNKKQIKFIHYLYKEFSLGAIFGLIFGISSGIIAYIWLKNILISLSVGISCLLTILLAPIVALFIAHIIKLTHRDPAAGSGPIATVFQDMISVIIYGIVTSLIIL
jgi:magnesium transporter